MFKSHNKNEICPITTVLTVEPVITSCGHVYEKSALCAWLNINKTCPLCRENLHDEKKVGAALIRKIYMQCVAENMHGCSFIRHLW